MGEERVEESDNKKEPSSCGGQVTSEYNERERSGWGVREDRDGRVLTIVAEQSK